MISVRLVSCKDDCHCVILKIKTFFNENVVTVKVIIMLSEWNFQVLFIFGSSCAF